MSLNHLFLADLHINIVSEFDKYRFRLLREKIKSTIATYKPSALFYLGDLFHRSPSKYSTTALLTLLYENQLPTFVLEGNHDRSKNDEYLKDIITEVNFSHVTWLGDFNRFELDSIQYEAASNQYIRLGNKLNPDPNTVLLSHLACQIHNKKPEYDFEELNKYKLTILGDIHNAFKIDPYEVYYTGSPYKTTFTTIESLDEIDNSGLGCLVFNGDSPPKRIEFNLPNKYRLNWYDSNPPKLNSDDYIEIIYNLPLSEANKVEGKVKVLTNYNVKIVKEDLPTAVIEYLNTKYNLTDEELILTELSKITGE